MFKINSSFINSHNILSLSKPKEYIGDTKPYGYYYKDNRWWEQEYDLNTNSFKGKPKYADIVSNELGGKKLLMERIKSKPDGDAWLVYTDSAGTKRIENTAVSFK